VEQARSDAEKAAGAIEKMGNIVVNALPELEMFSIGVCEPLKVERGPRGIEVTYEWSGRVSE
jgi:hypothetical protein